MQYQNREPRFFSGSARKALFAIFVTFFLSSAINAQSTLFRLAATLPNEITPATDTYEMEFRLFDAATAGDQIGVTNLVSSVDVKTRSFTVWLDFGAAAFPGADRFIEIRVRRNNNQPFTTITPRERILSVPYAIRALNATTADNLSGFDPSDFVLTADPRLSDSRDPNPGSVHYIHNGTSQQVSANFNIGGTGTANILNAGVQYNIGGNRILTNAGTNNTLAGIGTGPNNSGTQNSFFGSLAGNSNSSGGANSFFGFRAGVFNFSGTQNSYFGNNAGSVSQGSSNSYFGAATGGNGNGGFNSFFGMLAGASNNSGQFNSFVGFSAGTANTTGGNNAILGANANVDAGDLNFATAIGSGALVSASNTVVLGRSADTVQVPGTLNVSGDFGANALNAATQFNLGGSRVLVADSLNYNLFLGKDSGQSNSIGAGFDGKFNLFVGQGSGFSNTTGCCNNFFGNDTGYFNTTGSLNSFHGGSAGFINTSGSSNAFFGDRTGGNNISGDSNSFFGVFAGFNNTTGSNNTLVGSSANVGPGNLDNATAIGSNSLVTQSNSVVLGSIVTNVGIGTSAPKAKLHVTGGKIYVEANGQGVILKSPGGLCFELTVIDAGALTTAAAICP